MGESAGAGSSDRRIAGGSCGGESVPGQETTATSKGCSTLSEEFEGYDRSPSECGATPSAEKEIAERAANLDVCSPRLLPEWTGGLAAAAPARSSPVGVMEVTTLPSSPVELETSLDSVDAKERSEGTGKLGDQAAERADPKECRGRGSDEEYGGVEIEQVQVALFGEGDGDGEVGTGAENEEQRVQSTPKEEGQELRRLEDGGDQQKQGGERSGQQGEEQEEEDEGEAGHGSDEEGVGSPSVSAATAAAVVAVAAADDDDEDACPGVEVLPALLFSPGSDSARVVTGFTTAAEQGIQEEGAVRAEAAEGELEEDAGEENFAVPSAEDLNDKFIQVAVRARSSRQKGDVPY